MYQIWYEFFSESYPKFINYKIRQDWVIQKLVFHKNLQEIIWQATEYSQYQHIFLLDEQRFSFSRFDIFKNIERPFTIQDLNSCIKDHWDNYRVKSWITGKQLTSYIDTIYVNGEEKKFLIWETGDIFFRLYLVYLDRVVLNIFNSVYGNVLAEKNISIVPQSFYTLSFLRNTLQKENFLLLEISENHCKIIKEQNWFYQTVEQINLWINALRQMYKDNDVLEYREKSYDEIESNNLAKTLVIRTITFFVELLNKRMYDKNLIWSDVFVLSALIKNGHFIEIFNQEYRNYTNSYIVPFHYSDQLNNFGQKREAQDMHPLIYINSQKNIKDFLLK